MPLSYGRYWEALYEEGNEDEGILILHFILLLFLFLELYNFVKASLLYILYFIVNVCCSYFTLSWTCLVGSLMFFLNSIVNCFNVITLSWAYLVGSYVF